MRRPAHSPRSRRGPSNRANHHVEDDQVRDSGSDPAGCPRNSHFRTRRRRSGRRRRRGRQRWNEFHRDGRRPFARHRYEYEHEQQHQPQRRRWQYGAALRAKPGHQQHCLAVWHERQQCAVLQPGQQQCAERFRRRFQRNRHGGRVSTSLSSTGRPDAPLRPPRRQARE
jgi:hypothetical protein